MFTAWAGRGTGIETGCGFLPILGKVEKGLGRECKLSGKRKV